MRRAAAGLALAGALHGSACLLPQTDTILPDIPPPLNQPPRIVQSGLQPPTSIFQVDGGPGCPELVFAAPVEDPDVNDVIFYDYYVDANVNPGPVTQGTLAPSGEPLRTEEASYTVSFSVPGPLTSPGTHLVEVVVADGPLINRVPLPRTVQLPDGGTRTDPTFAVTNAWEVTVTGGPCP
ncbi:MAG TPA: hypothetical protein VEJ89_04565 [Myxococcaceae bacterium]|jgi:hypothetical protein|nr:hypothetical protein [Myxococcaceae bacterium]